MGPEGAILCHVFYAWAISYGVDENGQLDVPEGGEAPDGPIDLVHHGDGEIKREEDRKIRKSRMSGVLEVILTKMDECGIMRKPSWDGVRALLLILPLTEGMSDLHCAGNELTCRGVHSGGASRDVRSCDLASIHSLLLHRCRVRWGTLCFFEGERRHGPVGCAQHARGQDTYLLVYVHRRALPRRRSL